MGRKLSKRIYTHTPQPWNIRIRLRRYIIYFNRNVTLLYCIVVGSRRLMHPDALQPKAYCTNRSYLHRQVSPSETIVVKGREMADEFCLKMPDFHVTFRDVLHAVNLRLGTNDFNFLPKEGVLRIYFALKNPTTSAGFEPANLGTKGQHATSGPPKPLTK